MANCITQYEKSTTGIKIDIWTVKNAQAKLESSSKQELNFLLERPLQIRTKDVTHKIFLNYQNTAANFLN